jgi:lipoprotein-releasing system ATP-binding protein
MPFLEVTALTKSYTTSTGQIPVLRDLSLSVGRGEMVAIVGASGVGKSTLLHVLGGLDRADAGRVHLDDVELTTLGAAELVAFRNAHVGFVFQFHHLLPEFSAEENVAMPLRIARRSAADSRPRAVELLTRVGLGGRLSHRPGTLSGGEQQRVAMARALAMKPALLLADEPTGNLDEHTAETLHDLLREMHREQGLTSVIATHNPRLAALCDRVLRLADGTLHEVAGGGQVPGTGLRPVPVAAIQSAEGMSNGAEVPPAQDVATGAESVD